MSSPAPFPKEASLGKPVCVFCGSSPGSQTIFTVAAQAVGEALTKEKIPLVYGGGRRGIMGVVSQAVLHSGGYVHGIVPRALMSRASEHTPTPSSTASSGTPAPGADLKSKEGVGKDLLEDDVDGRLSMEVVGTMHDRKLKMAQISTGGFIVLPGGYGTFEEALEMITWNQLGIHKLPVIILNINNLFTPLRKLFEDASESGFINPENLSLVSIVDLPEGEAANADESKAGEWGAAAVKALRDWSVSDRAGYNLEWSADDKDPKVKAHPETASQIPPTPKTSSSALSLFTTMRFTSPSSSRPTIPIEKGHVPLLDRHIARLRRAHEHFVKRDGETVWGNWPGDELVWEALQRSLEESERAKQGDWRVRLLIHPGPHIEVQVLPAPADAGPFSLTFPPPASSSRRPLILDPRATSLEDTLDRDIWLYKTTQRAHYDAASVRGGPSHPEVLLHTSTHLLETATSNVALRLPLPLPPNKDAAGKLEYEWVTPCLTETRPFLDGTVRQELLERGVIREGEVTIEDWKTCRVESKEGEVVVVGFNGLRGVWAAELV